MTQSISSCSHVRSGGHRLTYRFQQQSAARGDVRWVVRWRVHTRVVVNRCKPSLFEQHRLPRRHTFLEGEGAPAHIQRSEVTNIADPQLYHPEPVLTHLTRHSVVRQVVRTVRVSGTDLSSVFGSHYSRAPFLWKVV